MHAVVAEVDINDADQALNALHEGVVPNIKQAPGFVAGYWIRLDDTHGTSVIVFDTKEQALAGAPEQGGSNPGVTFTRVADGEVVASA